MPPFLCRLALVAAAFLALAGPAGAATTLNTLPPSYVGQLSAGFRGEFTSDQWGQWWFEYGLTTAYGQELDRPGYSPGTHSPGLSPPLSPGTEYHYRLVVREGLFTGPFTYYYGEDQVLRTLDPTKPKVVETWLFVTVWDPLWGATVTMGIESGALATEAWVEYGETPALGLSSPRKQILPSTVGEQQSLELFPLTPRRTYYYRVSAENTLGRADGTLRSFTTGVVAPPPPPPAPPPAPPPPAPPPPPQPASATCIVPALRGAPLATARRRIARARCRVGMIRRTYSARVRVGRIVGQSPAGGRRVNVGARVSLVVSRGRR